MVFRKVCKCGYVYRSERSLHHHCEQYDVVSRSDSSDRDDFVAKFWSVEGALLQSGSWRYKCDFCGELTFEPVNHNVAKHTHEESLKW